MLCLHANVRNFPVDQTCGNPIKTNDDILKSEDSLRLVRSRFFAPYEPLVSISGYDEIQLEWNEDDTLRGITFPKSFQANRKVNVQATLHEMGHFITVPEDRCARYGFGFGGGTPYVSMGEFYRLPTGPWSATSEGQAIAWEIIAARDLFGISPDYMTSCSALRHSFDFDLYPGKRDSDRIAWVAGMVEEWVAEFGTVDDFEALWRQRCDRLPTIFANEDLRQRLLSGEAAERELVNIDIGGDEWSFELATYNQGPIRHHTASVTCSAAEGQEEVEFFAEAEAGRKWIDRVIRLAEQSIMPDDEHETDCSAASFGR